MRSVGWLPLILLIGGCSCDRRPEAQIAPVREPPAQANETAVGQDPALQAVTAPLVVDQANGVAASVSTVHAYVAAVAAKDWAKADAYWSGGKPPPRPDDFALRGVEDLRSLRINNESPKPLDSESPPQSVEIPVTLRVRKDAGVYEIRGWYRLRRKIGGDGWEITSASLQPSIV